MNSQNRAYILNVKGVSHPLNYQNDVIQDKFCKIKNYFLGDFNSHTSGQV